MKAESDSGLLFFPSRLEMGKEGECVFLVDQKAQPPGYKNGTVEDWATARSGLGGAPREEAAATAGLGCLGRV